MPKVSGRVIATKKDETGAMLMKAQLNGRLPPSGALIQVKWGSLRSLEQNALLWAYYTWIIENGLKEYGFFCPEAIHESLKAHFLADKVMTKGEWKAVEDGSTTTLTKTEFSEYIKKIDHFICDFFEINTTPFWDEYKQNKEGDFTGELTEEGKAWAKKEGLI